MLILVVSLRNVDVLVLVKMVVSVDFGTIVVGMVVVTWMTMVLVIVGAKPPITLVKVLVVGSVVVNVLVFVFVSGCVLVR